MIENLVGVNKEELLHVVIGVVVTEESVLGGFREDLLLKCTASSDTARSLRSVLSERDKTPRGAACAKLASSTQYQNIGLKGLAVLVKVHTMLFFYSSS